MIKNWWRRWRKKIAIKKRISYCDKLNQKVKIYFDNILIFFNYCNLLTKNIDVIYNNLKQQNKILWFIRMLATEINKVINSLYIELENVN